MKVTLNREQTVEAIRAFVRFQCRCETATVLNEWAICGDVEVEIEDREPDGLIRFGNRADR